MTSEGCVRDKYEVMFVYEALIQRPSFPPYGPHSTFPCLVGL